MNEPGKEYRELDLELLWMLNGLGFTLYVKPIDFNGRHEGGPVSVFVKLQEDGDE